MDERVDLESLSIDDLGLSNRARNALKRNKIFTAEAMIGLTQDQIFAFRNVGAQTGMEIMDLIQLISDGGDPTAKAHESIFNNQSVSFALQDKRREYKNHIEHLYQYVSENDVALENMGLSNRSTKRLIDHGCRMFTDVIKMTDAELYSLPSMGSRSVAEINKWINDYLTKHESRLKAFLDGDESALWDEKTLQAKILELYKNIGFDGLSYEEMASQLDLPDFISEEKIKKEIGGLIACRELEYVDFRCYRVYGKFEEILQICPTIDSRARGFLNKRIHNYTLEAIAKEHDITRERVRQIVVKARDKVRSWYYHETGERLFDEDYYRYFYENYSFSKSDATEYLGIPTCIWGYLDMNDAKQGTGDIRNAVKDQSLDMGLRIKIKSYLNRSKIFIQGRWVEKQRAELEDVLVSIICKDNTSFEEFTKGYNSYLQDEEIPFDENIYFTDAVIRTRKNRLADSRYLLWKQNEQIRYYDIDAREYDELYDVLNLGAYENIEISTLKFMEEHEDTMVKYDIRDQYELHNLIRKTIKKEDYPDIDIGRMPMIRFGVFDREGAILETMRNNAPISQEELVDLLHKEYGFDQATIIGTYLNHLRKYLVNGIYTLEQKKMSPDNLKLLTSKLSDDFYFIDEVKEIYSEAVPNADLQEINQYNLNEMGFTVYSKWILQNHPTQEEYFRSILQSSGITDITEYKKRYSHVISFYSVLTDLKKNLDIVEFEPNQIITIEKLEKGGITRDMISDFCDDVYEFIDSDVFFSARSLRLDAFNSDLYDYGFSDWFYANVLLSDDRFSWGNVFGIMLFNKGDSVVSRKAFLKDRVEYYESIDMYDLLSEMSNTYGCRISDDDRYDVVHLLQDTNIYYDDTLDRLYMNEDAFYADFERSIGK